MIKRKGRITIDVFETDTGLFFIGNDGLMSPVPENSFTVNALLSTELDILEKYPKTGKKVEVVEIAWKDFLSKIFKLETWTT
jgi:hypothetical protein